MSACRDAPYARLVQSGLPSGSETGFPAWTAGSRMLLSCGGRLFWARCSPQKGLAGRYDRLEGSMVLPLHTQQCWIASQLAS